MNDDNWRVIVEDGIVLADERMAYNAGIEAAAKAVRESWEGGYRGEVSTGFERVVRTLLSRPEPPSGR
jgi:hypothetical protein